MEFPGINSDFAWKVYMALARAECEWRRRNGLPQRTQYLHVEDSTDDGRRIVWEREVKPPRHPVYGRLIESLLWLGFVPF